MLGRTERESATHAAAAAATAGWTGLSVPEEASWDSAPVGPVELLDLGGVTDTLATVAVIGDLSAVVHLGHPEQPAPALEEALLSGDPALMLTDAVAVPTEWAWVGLPDAAPHRATSGVVVLDEAGLRDCREALRPTGASLRLVSARTSVDERLALAGPDGSVVVERSRVPSSLVELPSSRRLAELGPIWYGLLEARGQRPDFTESAEVWLAFGPGTDHRGSLRETLGVLSDAGLDLQHLRSQPTPDGPHHFFAAFRCRSAQVLDDLVADLHARGVANRTLAVLPGNRFEPGPAALAPIWTNSPTGGAPPQ